MRSFLYVFFCIMIMSSSLCAKKNNASDEIYSIVQNSPVGELCNIDICEYRKGVFTVTAACTDSNGKEARSFVTKLNRDDLYRLCIVDNTIYSEKDCIAKLDPKEGEEFSQELTDVVKNETSAGKDCKNIKVFKAKGLADAYNVYADCSYLQPLGFNPYDEAGSFIADYFEESSQSYYIRVSRSRYLYFLQKKDLFSLCNLHGYLKYGQKCK